MRAVDGARARYLSVLFLAAAAAAFVIYAGALLVLRRLKGALLPVCMLAAVIQLLPLAGPLLLSRDVFSYWSYGRLVAVHEANPYVVPPARFPRDPSVQAVAAPWRRTVSVYGPTFTGASAGVARLAGRSPEIAAYAFRILAASAMLILVGLAAVVSRRPSFAAAAVGWNPLLALHFAGGGHNDALMMVPVLAALALTRRRRSFTAGAGWALAVTIKWVVLVLLPLQLLAVDRRERRRLLGGFGAGAALLGAGALLTFGSSWLGALTPLAHRTSAFSVAGRLAHAGFPPPLSAFAPEVFGAAGLAVIAWRARSGRARLGLAAVLVLLASPWLLPWYAVWALPLAAAEGDVTATWIAVAVSAYLLADRVPL